MGGYALRRILITIPVLIVVSLFTFALLHMAPGSPVQVLLGSESYDPVAVKAIRHEYRLDQPLSMQFVAWSKQTVHGNLGKSIMARRPVAGLIWDRLPVTLELTAAALLLSTVFGLFLGITSALRQRRALDSAVRVISLLGVSVPSFVFGILLVMLFGLYLPGVIPFGQWVPITDNLGANLWHLVLPAVALSMAPLGIIARQSRSSMLDVLGREHITIAHAFGVSRGKIILLDALKNALIPVLTVLGVIIPQLVGGAIVIESIFNIPGVGRLLADGLLNRDYPLVSGIVLMLSVLVMIVNLVVDLTYGILNPRIAHSYRALA